jgi:tetratricopeptide (TPR) repeat protein
VLTTCENNTADVLEILGRTDEANKLFKNAVAHSRRLVEADPSNKELELEHVTKLRRLGMSLTDLRDFDPALKTLEEALNVVKPELLKATPDPNRLLEIALGHDFIAELQLAREEFSLADKELDLALEVLSHPALAKQAGLTRDARAYLHVTRGALLERRQSTVEAKAEAQAGWDILDAYFWKLFSGRRARAYVNATRIAQGDAAVTTLFDRFRAMGYVHPPSAQSARGN